MITANPQKTVQVAFVTAENPIPKCRFEFDGLSSDTKPTVYEGVKVGNGSTLLEMDTSKVYAFDEEGETWGEL